MRAYACNPSNIEAEMVDLQDSLTSQPNLLDEFQASKTLSKGRQVSC